ncbi:MAG: hypothetical protein GXX91_12640 [Verrucomicrobiaceae bacterium]|nr:hypothetical protein [Verrucomicrobiaceae bacterium]
MIARLNAEGWNELRQRGSHRIFGHARRGSAAVISAEPAKLVNGANLN